MDSHYIHHIDSLALTRFCGYQEEHPLTILLPLSLTTKLRYVVRAAYVDSPLSTTKWVIDELMRAYVRVLTG
ncbi:hypothetical protein VCHA50O407_340022 [Vibrio chagasii]|nr:hypothetical protein VCHA50O407_340022 [Vibrio chagasii]CAK2967293.1 hypothetical protein VCRA217O134_340024 [Vibrio crassostreae]